MTITNLEKAEHDKLVLENELFVVEAAISQHAAGVLLNEGDCDMYLEVVIQQRLQLAEIQRRIINTKPADLSTHNAAYETCSKRIFKARSFLMKLKKTLTPSISSSSASSSQPPSIRLPKLELPKFTGNYEEWQSFQDLFQNTVMKNTTISDAEKLSYLRSCVQGEASQLIKSFTITDLHFKEAWDLLESRYNNKKEIVQSLVRRLINQPCVKNESAAHLQLLQNTTNECLRSLRVLGRDIDHWDDLIVIIIADKMDGETRAEWAKCHRGTNPPTYKELETFLTDHTRSLIARGNINKGSQPQQRAAPSTSKQVSTHVTTSPPQCIVCNNQHLIFNCESFKAMSVNDRNAFAKSKALCFNCLRSGHSLKECKSFHKCKTCSKSHNTLLHREQQSQQSAESSKEGNSSSTTTVTSTTAIAVPPSSGGSTTVMLKTVKLMVSDHTGHWSRSHHRRYLDECSQSSYITESCATALGLNRRSTNITVNGIGAVAAGKLKQSVNFLAKSRINNQVIPVEALVMGKITTDREKIICNSSTWKHIKLEEISLADPDFAEPGKIDILLGAEVAAYALEAGLKRGVKGVSPTAQNTIFGWVLFGDVQHTTKRKEVTTHITTCEIDTILRRFWELEDIPKMKHLTKEESQCEDHFINTYKRNEEGRYICRLPFNSNKMMLGDSKQQALLRFNQLEKRFRRQPAIKEQYIKFMREYLDLRHMEVVPENEEDKPNCYYIPHHCVTREDSTTTKLRVVFDGSAKTTTGLSLNDVLLVGPVVQDDLFSILLQFRGGPIAVKGDFEKMYRQFLIDKEDTDYLRIYWRENDKELVRSYRLLTATYGTAPAPYQATRCLHQLATDESSKYPAAAATVKNNTYVDDILASVKTKEKAIILIKELNSMAKAGGMSIRKWASNSPDVLSTIDPAVREKESISFDIDSTIKALGVHWNPADDSFLFKVNTSPPRNVTKRVILSELAKVFDPLGWLSPVTINAKIIFQELWKCKLEWDQSPNESFINMWNEYQQSLATLKELQIPRCIISAHPKEIQLHAFSDSSSKAFCGSVYLREVSMDGAIRVNLVAAKTRVAPIQQQSIPRLELCGAELVCELVDNVKEKMKLTCEVFGWTDSTIVLHWLASYPGRWKTFIANRVSKIQKVIPYEKWGHVVSQENPADCGSRGISANDLLNNTLWWHGPSWLCTEESTFPATLPPSLTTNPDGFEEKKTTTMLATVDDLDYLMHRYSSIYTLQRVVAYTLRFLNNIRSKEKSTGGISAKEIMCAKRVIIKYVQNQHFNSEIQQLLSSKQIKCGRLSQLNPFLDSDGVLRVGGRLHHARENEDVKHPILLPVNHPFTTLIIRNCHFRNMQSGFKLTLCTLQQQYWILRARDVVRGIIRKCITCRKQRAELSQQLMGSLPSPRVNPSRPFSKCGLDYAGPYNITMKIGRGQKSEKRYFCIFVCLATKAIHLECVDSLSTADFLACFKRFTARRGIPNKLYSDNGTTFVGADNELKPMLNQFSHDETKRDLGSSGTEWIFNPPSAPHQGGLWEAGVKAVKYHLRRVIGAATISRKEFETLLIMVEACVNSRPLCALSSDPADVNALTPGHFLIGGPLNAVPEPDLTLIKLNRLSRWQQTQQMLQHFWRRWRGEYLTSLQQRFKWKTKRENLQINDLVIIKEDNVPPMKWKLGRITATHPGHDGLVRVVTIRTATSELQRPTAKLCPILTCNDDDDNDMDAHHQVQRGYLLLPQSKTIYRRH